MMKPFSPLYFIRKNRGRCVIMLFMVFLTYSAYLGGGYITNIQTLLQEDINSLKKVAVVTDLVSDDNQEDYYRMKAMLDGNKNVHVISQGIKSEVVTDCMAGFTSIFVQYTFNSVEDFKIFCRHVNIHCDFDKLRNGSVIMSELSANNKGIKVGDALKEGKNDNIFGEYTLDALTDETGYHIYYIDERPYDESYLILNTGMGESEFIDYTNELMNEYEVYIYNSKNYAEWADRETMIFKYIYLFILIIFALVLAVVINAAFVGIYQRRQYEFSVYKALGYGRRQIVGKIAGELVCMDIIGLAAGGGIFFLSLYLFNNLYLNKVGKILFYYHPLALFGIMLCNVVMIVPLIFTRCRQMLRADICEY